MSQLFLWENTLFTLETRLPYLTLQIPLVLVTWFVWDAQLENLDFFFSFKTNFNLAM